MNIDQDTLEILISRRLDDEITPIEDQLLQETLAADPAAMTLFEQLSELPGGSVVYVPTEGGIPLMRNLGGGG